MSNQTPPLPAFKAMPRRRLLVLAMAASLAGGTMEVAQAQLFPAVINLGSLDGSNGFRLDGAAGRDGAAAGDYSGHSVSAAGDINGDGIDDLIVGAPGADPNGNSFAGSSYVVFGRLPAYLIFADGFE